MSKKYLMILAVVVVALAVSVSSYAGKKGSRGLVNPSANTYFVTKDYPNTPCFSRGEGDEACFIDVSIVKRDLSCSSPLDNELSSAIYKVGDKVVKVDPLPSRRVGMASAKPATVRAVTTCISMVPATWSK